MNSQCAACGASVPRPQPADDTPAESSPDFDTRPGEPVRSTISTWVTRCEQCGYCSADLTHIHESGPRLLHEERYRRALEDTAMPAKAREFLCYGLILEDAGALADAGWSALQAAWVADDAGAISAAVACRDQAVRYWKAGKERGQNFSDDVATEFALIADVYRRSGQFEHAIVACSDALDSDELPDVLARLLRKQKSLSEQRDQNCHSMAELW